MNPVETSDVVAFNVKAVDARGEQARIQRHSRDNYDAVEILAQLDQITEVPCELYAVNFYRRGKIKIVSRFTGTTTFVVCSQSPSKLVPDRRIWSRCTPTVKGNPNLCWLTSMVRL